MRNKQIQDQEPLSLFQIIGPSSSTCGYCSPSGQRSKSKSSKSFGIWAHQMSCKTYKELIDRGWRRSGSYVYKPDMRATCCPQYTIRLEADKFTPNKSQRKIVNRFNSFVHEGGHEGEEGYGPATPQASTSQSIQVASSSTAAAAAAEATPENAEAQDRKGKGKAKGKHNQTFELIAAIHECETDIAGDTKHLFEVTMEPASFTPEKYELYKRYQMQVHGDTESKVTEDGFKRFLCDSPLELEKSPSDEYPYGSFHQLYRLDGQLIAIGVLDVLPGALSAVYFIYDPQWSSLSLGKLSALRECALAVELERLGFEKMYYMMGYYIHSCQKMKYKAEYSPSYLLDPVTHEWLPFEAVCKPILDKDDHAIFSEYQNGSVDERKSATQAAAVRPTVANSSDREKANNTEPDNSEEDDLDADDDEETLSKPPPPGFLDPDNLPQDLLLSIYTFENGKPLPLIMSKTWRTNPDKKRKIQEGIAAMGITAVETCLFA